MANSKRRCTVCRDYFPAGDMLRQGVCGEECLQALVDRSRAKRQRRAGSKARRHAGPSLPYKLRVKVKKRDAERCRMCGRPDTLQVHHIAYRSEGGSDDLANLITLCALHHNEGLDSVHADKRRWQPICRAYVWIRCVEGRFLLLPEIERRLARDAAVSGNR